jgi:hypothetical protein
MESGGVDALDRRRAARLHLVRGDIDGAALADHRHLDLPRVLQVALDLACDLVREQNGSVVVDLLRLDEDADLTSCLERVDLVDAGVARCELLE